MRREAEGLRAGMEEGEGGKGDGMLLSQTLKRNLEVRLREERSNDLAAPSLVTKTTRVYVHLYKMRLLRKHRYYSHHLS